MVRGIRFLIIIQKIKSINLSQKYRLLDVKTKIVIAFFELKERKFDIGVTVQNIPYFRFTVYPRSLWTHWVGIVSKLLYP